ncbi:hypothetical protein F5Y06DRAFT_300676 [Hypoxylon sp. FL0890]|nr:hypothetical protein F5Y06DRAFT_300676 [Hypoxylon sp. FL0890]
MEPWVPMTAPKHLLRRLFNDTFGPSSITHTYYEILEQPNLASLHMTDSQASKATLMVGTGSPRQLYAIKEFRCKSSPETVEEYEKKIKSEYNIAKSLHHPNSTPSHLTIESRQWRLPGRSLSIIHGDLPCISQRNSELNSGGPTKAMVARPPTS